jgi:rhodanese-related sulfurtransferase
MYVHLLEYDLGHIPGSVNFELDELRNNLDKLPSKDTPIYVTCQVGHRGYLSRSHLTGKRLYQRVQRGWRISFIRSRNP